MTVVLALDTSDAATATHDIDYISLLRSVTIPAGQAQGSQTISITPKDDGIEDADEKIILKAMKNPKNDEKKEIAVGTATIALKDTGAVGGCKSDRRHNPGLRRKPVGHLGRGWQGDATS